MHMRLTMIPPVAVVPLLLMTGCAASDEPAQDPSSDSFTIVTDMYPTTFAVEQVVGDGVEVVQLTPAGVEPHEYELTPQQVQQIADADLVAYLPGMIPAFEDAVEQEAADRAVDVTQGIAKLEEGAHEEGDEHAEEGSDEHGAADPHVWLDPKNVAIMGANVADALTGLGVSANAADLDAQMAALDQEISSTLGNCTVNYLVTGHAAFAYLADAYGFEQVGISGLSPEAQPSPAKMAEITDLVNEKGITTIYFEELLPREAAETIAAETGAATALLDPIEGNTDDSGYPAIMRSNTETLKTGQSCS
jgi:zinc transport system substrate-binding protein